jgi:hypothetical protein
MVDTTDPTYWEMPLEGESNALFAKFQLYLATPKPRSKLGAYRADMEMEQDRPANTPGNRRGQLNRLKKPPKTVPQSWREAFRDFEWEKRAAAYDRYKAKQQLQQIQDWEMDYRQELMDGAKDSFRLAKEMSTRSLETKLKITDKGEVLELPAHWTARDIATFRLAGAQLGKQAIQKPEVDVLQAIELLVAEGILDGDVLNEGEQGYDELRERVRSAIRGKSEPKPEE